MKAPMGTDTEKSGAPMPESSEEALARALAEHRAGRPEAAEPVYRRLVAEAPACHAAWHLLGIVLLNRGAAPEAVAHIGRALDLAPDNARYAANLGVACQAAGRSGDAIAAFERVHALDPTDGEPLFAIGTIHQEANDAARAEAFYRRALALDPGHAPASNNLGVLLKDAGRREDARALFERAAAADAGYVEAHLNLGQLAEELGDVAVARRHFDTVLARGPDPAAAFKRALLLPVVYGSAADVAQHRRRFEAALAGLAASPPRLRDPLREGSRAPFFLAYQGYDDRAVNEALAGLYRRACPELSYVAPHCRAPRPPAGRIRIGFVSKHLRGHTIGKLNRGLIAGLPRAAFEVTVFSVGASDDAMAAEIRNSADHAVRLPATLEGARRAIADRGLDILYFPDIGMEPFTYFLAFARLAPVQCTTWGHPVTSGLDTLDYFVSCRAAETAQAGAHYSERLVPFERFSTCFRRPARVSGARAEFGLPEGRTIYLCPQTLFKLHPDMDAAFTGIAARDPRALFVLIDMGNPAARAGLEARWAAAAPQLARHVVFVPRMDEAKFMRLLTLADVMLDPFPFCGGNTSLEAFAQHVPIVTFPSELLRGRLTAALYAQMGIAEGVAESLEAYVARAVAIATDRDRHAALVGAIAERADALFDDREVIAEFARFFETAARGAGASG